MDTPVTIAAVLDLRKSAEDVKRQLSTALNSPDALAKTKEAGRKHGEALSLGIETGRNRNAAEQKELAHIRRLETIHLQNASRIEQIERRKQAQIETIRERAFQQEQTRLKRLETQAQASARNISAAFRAVGGLLPGFGVAAFGVAAVDQAFAADRLRVQLTSMLGSLEKANAKILEFRKIAKETPGVLASGLVEAFTQLRQIAGLTDATATRFAKAVNQIKALFPAVQDVGGFALNLQQIFSQGFELSDVKQTFGTAPGLFQAVQTRLGAANLETLREMKKQGKLTAEQFAQGFIDEITARSGSITETLQLRIAKALEETNIKLAELGDKLLKDFIPILEKLLPPINQVLGVFTKLPTELQAATIAFIALGGSITKLAGSILGLGAAGSTAGFARVVAFLGSPAGLIALGAVGVTVSVAGIIQGFERMESDMRRRLDRTPRDLEGKPLFTAGIPAIGDLRDFRGRVGAGGGLSFDPVTGQFGGVSPAGAALTDLAKKSGGQRKLTEIEKAIEETKRLTEMVKALKANEGKLFEEEFKQLQLKFEQDELIKQLKNRAVRAVLTAQGKPLPADLPQGIGLPRGISLAGLGVGPNLGGLPGLTAEPVDTANSLDAARRRFETAEQKLRIQEARIQNQVTAGLLSQTEAQRALNAVRAASRDELIKALEIQRQHVDITGFETLEILEQIEQLKLLGVELSDTARFMAGFNSEIETSGDAFERFGQNVSRAFTNIKTLFDSLKQSVLTFFNDLLGQSLQNLMRQVLGPIFNAGGGGFGGFGGFAQAFAGGGGISAPPSITSGLSQLFSGGGSSPASGFGKLTLDPLSATQFGGAGKTSFLGGIGQSFAAAAPLLGLSFGSALGGQSTAGKIFGGIGGALAGSAKSLLGLGSALGIAGLVAAPFLLLGSFFLGKAKQRRSDEQAAGEMLTAALSGINELKAGIASDQIEGAQARGLFDTNILSVFRQQIGQLKTRSVRESRLTNQVRDLERTYQALIPPEITAQAERRARAERHALIHSRLVPEFATGGISRGGLAFLHRDEIILNLHQQANIARLAGPAIFQAAGVPGAREQRPVVDRGGGSAGGQPIIINLALVMGKGDATRLVIAGNNAPQVKAQLVRMMQDAKLDNEIG